MPDTTVAVLGTGTIGGPIARNLLEAGFDVRVWNRTRAKAELLAESGAVVRDTPAEAARGAAFVVTALADADAVTDTMAEGGAIAAMEDGAVWLQLATVGVAATDALGALAVEYGVAYIDAPVLGTKEPAEKGELVVLASGPADIRDQCAPVFEAIGKQTRWVGEAGMGTRLKMAVNMWLLAVNEAAAEALALAEGLGVDPHEFLGTIEGSAVDTPYLHVKGEKILPRSLEPSFKLSLAAKDARLVLEAAKQANVDLALARAAHEKLTSAAERGHGDEDMAATYFATAPA